MVLSFEITTTTNKKSYIAVKFMKLNKDVTAKDEYRIGKYMEEQKIGPKLYHFYQGKGKGYGAIVMQLFDISLHEFLELKPSHEQVKSVIDNVVIILSKMYNNLETICCDIKPSNFLINTLPEIEIVLIDYGPVFCVDPEDRNQIRKNTSLLVYIQMYLYLYMHIHRHKDKDKDLIVKFNIYMIVFMILVFFQRMIQ